MEDSLPVRSAYYGHACVACARSKCRCMPRASGNGCQRCHRLGKECQPSARVRKPKPLSRTAQLEQKLDSLTSFLQSKTGAMQTSLVGEIPMSSLLDRSEYRDQAPSPSSAPSPGNRQHPPTTPLSGVTMSEIEEESILYAFRTQRLPVLPFMQIPATTSASQLKQDSPFLWLCISAIQTQELVKKAYLAEQVRKVAAERIMINCEKSFDLLQGLLVYLAWFVCCDQPQKSSLCIYTQIAIGLVVELGLNLPPPPQPAPRGTATTPYTTLHELPPFKPPVSIVRSMNERRAVLGCYVSSSCNAQFLGRMEPLAWTPHLRECLDFLTQAPESEADRTLAQITRIRLVADKIIQQNSSNTSTSGVLRAPSSFHLQAMRSQLDDLKATIPPEVTDNTVSLHLLHTEITLYASALLWSNPSIDERDTGDTYATRLDQLYTCLVKIKKFFEVLAATPVTLWAAFSVIQLAQCYQALFTLFRLSTLENCPGWDRAAVRRTVDILAITEELEKQLQKVAEDQGHHHGHDISGTGAAVEKQQPSHKSNHFIGLHAVLRRLRDGWMARLESLDAVGKTPGDENIEPSNAAVDSQLGEDLNQPLPLGYTSLWGNSEATWLTDFFSTDLYPLGASM
ncbi:hypothetical protein BX600DRAFT_468355 [Xylariales sp. PMI_506]|nr:hypothetical protein BX600DRAFT_468355 [Xylariales sp. PMI_506]